VRREDVQLQQLITNGIVAVYVIRRARQGGGYEGTTYRIRPYGPKGIEMFVPDASLPDWEPVPFEWTPVDGKPLEERYVVDQKQASTLHREIRPLNPVPRAPGSTVRQRRMDVLRGVMAQHPDRLSKDEVVLLLGEAGLELDARTVREMLADLVWDGWAVRSGNGWKKR
jgi:hypothetical protein